MVCTLPSCLYPTTLTFPQRTAAPQGQTSTHIEIVDDDDDIPGNVPPSKSCRILELSDGSNGDDDEDLPVLMEVSNDDDDEVEEVEEMAEAELGKSLLLHLSLLVSDPNTHAEQLIKEWNSPIYVFFKHTPSIETIKGTESTFSSAMPRVAWARGMARWCIDIWTPVMQSQQATFRSMLEATGEKKRSRLPTIPRMYRLHVRL